MGRALATTNNDQPARSPAPAAAPSAGAPGPGPEGAGAEDGPGRGHLRCHLGPGRSHRRPDPRRLAQPFAHHPQPQPVPVVRGNPGDLSGPLGQGTAGVRAGGGGGVEWRWRDLGGVEGPRTLARRSQQTHSPQPLISNQKTAQLRWATQSPSG